MRASLAPIPSGRRSTAVANDGNLGYWWLRAAAEMAAVASGICPLSADPPPRWACFPSMSGGPQDMDAGSVRVAREFTLATCRGWGMTERRDDVGIVVSELLTNALRHAPPRSGQSRPGWPVQLGLLQPGPCVLCAVADPSPSAPIPRTPGYLAETGRGLQVVDVLSDEWGYITCATSNSTAKVVWAMFVTSPVCAARTPPGVAH